VHKFGNKIECNNMHGGKIKIIKYIVQLGVRTYMLHYSTLNILLGRCFSIQTCQVQWR